MVNVLLRYKPWGLGKRGRGRKVGFIRKGDRAGLERLDRLSAVVQSAQSLGLRSKIQFRIPGHHHGQPVTGAGCGHISQSYAFGADLVGHGFVGRPVAGGFDFQRTKGLGKTLNFGWCVFRRRPVDPQEAIPRMRFALVNVLDHRGPSKDQYETGLKPLGLVDGHDPDRVHRFVGHGHVFAQVFIPSTSGGGPAPLSEKPGQWRFDGVFHHLTIGVEQGSESKEEASLKVVVRRSAQQLGLSVCR